MPVLSKKGWFCVFFLFTPFFLFSRTLYFSYFEETVTEEPVGSEFASFEARNRTVVELVRLELPYLLDSDELKEVEIPEEKKSELIKILTERIPEEDDKTESFTDDETGEMSVSDGESEASEESGSSSDGESVLSPELNGTSFDPVFDFVGITGVSDQDAFSCIVMKKFERKVLSGGKIFLEADLNFYLAYENRKEILFSGIRAVGLGENDGEAIERLRQTLTMTFKSVLNSFFGKSGTPYIVDFVNDKKAVIAQGRNQGAFPGAFYQIVRHQSDGSGGISEKIIGRLLVEKCEENYSFCRILYASDRPVPGDSVRKVPGIGLHQSVGYDLVVSAVAVSETDSEIYLNHLITTRWAVGRGMPLAKPVFGFEILTGSRDQLDTVGMMQIPALVNFYVGLQVDRFFHQFSFSPFVDFGVAFTPNMADNKETLTWFTCKAGVRFLWLFHEKIGVYVEGGYFSWLGIPGREAIFEDAEYMYFAPNDYTGGFGGVGLTFFY